MDVNLIAKLTFRKWLIINAELVIHISDPKKKQHMSSTKNLFSMPIIFQMYIHIPLEHDFHNTGNIFIHGEEFSSYRSPANRTECSIYDIMIPSFIGILCIPGFLGCKVRTLLLSCCIRCNFVMLWMFDVFSVEFVSK